MSHSTVVRSCLVLLLTLCLMACASLTPDLDPPKVSVESFRSLPSQEGAPRFEIQLRVINPNDTDLDIVGISYSIDILDREVMTGVTNEVPLIAAYSEEIVTLEAGLQMFQLLRMLLSLGRNADEPLSYRFSAKIDFAGLVPTQRVEESGEINLQ